MQTLSKAPNAEFGGSSFLDAYLILIRLHGSKSERADILHFSQVPEFEFTPEKAILYSKSIAFSSKLVKLNPNRINRMTEIAIGFNKQGQAFIFRHMGQDILVKSVACEPVKLTEAQFLEIFSGYVFLTKSKQSILGRLAKFDFSWFIPVVVHYRKELGYVLLLSLFVQLIALATPLFFQVVTDKVLVHSATTTLNVIAVGLLITITFDAVMTYLRSYIFNHTSSRIDVKLGAQLYKHLIALPSSYFGVRRVGDSVARVRELENIRTFLTNNSVTLILDILFSFVFLGVMLYYSIKLTLIAIAVLPLYALISYLVTPTLRKRLADKFSKGSENQSFLVESLSGIDTVKSLCLEPAFAQQWDKNLASYVKSSFSVTTISSTGGVLVNVITKLSTLSIMYFGASMVMDHTLTIGQLIAFNMLSGQITGPIMRMANLWSEFQQVGISMERLGDILNTVPENHIGKSSVGTVAGKIEIKNLSFAYRFDGKPVLNDVSIEVPAGQTIGLVGRSGSGKSTLTKLIQGLYTPSKGSVLIDGVDISSISPASLRTQIGVVLQENYLFKRSIRDNIALAMPNTSIEQIVAAATLAGAHEFIGELPDGYETILEERGSSLSGGQRQRIAIARALITNPRILIFDEATSALDYESEQIIQNNMAQICQGRTVLIIAHRLSAVRHADCIYVLDKGSVIEKGSHQDLFAQGGLYTYLNNIQGGQIG